MNELMLKRRWVGWVLLAVVSTLFGLLDAFGSYAASNAGRYTIDWTLVLIWDVLSWNLWILLAPLILWVGRRFRLDQPQWFRNVIVCALIGLLVALVHGALLLLIYFSTIPETGGVQNFLSTKYFVLISDGLTSLVVYGMILMFSHAAAYYKRYRQEEVKSSRLEGQLVQAQLRSLKMQLQPHFLFNTLHSISALQMEDVAAAQKMMARLGDFLRLTLENVGTQEVSLKREMEFLKCYLDIEQVRFQNRLAVRIEIEPETLDARVPNLILQPVVENAFKHGVARRIAPGQIDITARRAGGRLIVQVKDNGPGLPRNGGPLKVFKEGLGLANTRARLEQLYNEDYRLELSDTHGGGVTATLEIPYITDDSAAADPQRASV